MTSFIRTEEGHELYAIGQVIKVGIRSTDDPDRWEVYFQTGHISFPVTHIIFGGTLDQSQLFFAAFIETANDGAVVIDPINLRTAAFAESPKPSRIARKLR